MKRLARSITVLFAFSLAACGELGGGVGPSPTPDRTATESISQSTPTASLPATATPPPQAVVPTSAPTQDSSTYLGVQHQGGVLGQVWYLADVRSASHPDRLQVVLEMAEPGDHVPQFKVVEVDNAISPFPTGHDPAWGAARIDVVVSDLYAYDFPLDQRLPIILEDNPQVTRIGFYPTFSDSELGFSIGLKTPSRYEVHTLADPVRIVIVVPYLE